MMWFFLLLEMIVSNLVGIDAHCVHVSEWGHERPMAGCRLILYDLNKYNTAGWFYGDNTGLVYGKVEPDHRYLAKLDPPMIDFRKCWTEDIDTWNVGIVNERVDLGTVRYHGICDNKGRF